MYTKYTEQALLFRKLSTILDMRYFKHQGLQSVVLYYQLQLSYLITIRLVSVTGTNTESPLF